MKLIKQIKTATCMFGDCMDYMKTLPDNYYKIAIVDPEYGIGASKPSIKPNKCKQKNGSILDVKTPTYNHKNWDEKPAGSDYFNELIRVSENQIIFGVNYYDYKFESKGRLVWDKLNWYSDQMDAELMYNSFNNRVDVVYYMWAGFMQGLVASSNPRDALIQQGNKKLNQKRIHPTEKPIKLYEWLHDKFNIEKNRVLDTHGGSFSHAQACINMGIDIDIIEKDEEYYKLAINRLNETN